MVPPPPTTVAIDNGGFTIKAGVVGSHAEPSIIPNCSARHKGERQVYIAETVASCPDILSLVIRRPIDRGYIVAFDLQREIWTRVLKNVLKIDPVKARICLSEPSFTLPALHDATLEVLFDQIGVQAVLLGSPALFSLRWHAHQKPTLPANIAGCGVVVDAGFSFTHAIPIFDWQVLEKGVRRIDLGGKALTNQMKTLVSYRSVNMMEETYLMDHIKEQLCFVSQDVAKDLAASKGRNSIHRRVYVLPDGVTSRLGHVLDEEAGEKPPQQKEMALTVNNERFMVPELIFHPSDIGLAEAGLAEMIAESVRATHPALHGLLYSNIFLTGGTACHPDFRERVEAELRPLVPDVYEVNVYVAEDPITCAWKGQQLVANDPTYHAHWLTQAEYRRQKDAITGAKMQVADGPDLAHVWESDEEMDSIHDINYG